jgi:hypothetical protein
VIIGSSSDATTIPLRLPPFLQSPISELAAEMHGEHDVPVGLRTVGGLRLLRPRELAGFEAPQHRCSAR